MRNVLKTAGLAAVMALGIGAGSGSVAAQGFDIRIGSDRPRVERRIYRDDRPRVIERRIIRPDRRVCRTEIRETVRPNGVVVRRPVQVCTSRGRY